MLRFRRLLVIGLALLGARCASCGEKFVHPEAIKQHDVAIQYLEQGQCVQAEERCRLALEYGENFEHPHNCLGMVVLQCQGDLDAAAAHFKDALAINQDFAEAHNNLGVTFFRRMPPNYGEACDQFKAAIEINPAYIDARENYATCVMRQGTIAGEKGDEEERTERYREARSHFIRLIQIAGDHYNARHHLGFMDLVEGRFEAAEQNFKQCLESSPENPVCAYNLGNTYLAVGRCSDAIEAYIIALRDKGQSEVDVGARKNLGAAYEQCAKKDGAIKEFLDRIKMDPGSPTHHFDLGNIYAERGLLDQAVNEWANASKLDPLYCPAYFELAMHANKVLDTDATIRHCQDFVACATTVNKDASTPRWPDRVDQCKALIKKLEVR